MRYLLRSMRPRQWVKNLFVPLPMVFAQQLFVAEAQLRAGIAFLLFCALSSAVYLFNDLLDRDKDRHHPLKRHRPLAAGTLSPLRASAASLGLAAAALGAAAWLGTVPLVIAVAYLVQNLLYSTWLKRFVVVDILIVSLGFVLRVMMGAAALPVEVSDWLLLCTIFLSLFLAVTKRRHEVVQLAQDAPDQRAVLSDYGEPFLDQMCSAATAAALIAYSLYATTYESGGDEPLVRLVFTVPFVIFGIFRYLYLVYQRGTKRSPTEEMLTDGPFVANLVVWGSVVLLSFYG